MDLEDLFGCGFAILLLIGVILAFAYGGVVGGVLGIIAVVLLIRGATT